MEGLFASGSPLWLILGIACFVFGGYGYYKSRKGLITAVGDRVVLAPISGSYVVLGTVGLPARKYNMNQCPTGSNATAANCASWINTLIEALTAQGLMSKNGW